MCSGAYFISIGPLWRSATKKQPHRRIGDAEFLRHDVALEEGALAAAVFLRPGHADPALGADAAAQLRAVLVAVAGLLRIEGAGGDFLGEEGAHFRAQRLAFGRQADRIETRAAVIVDLDLDQRDASGHNASAPRAATSLPSSTAQWLSLPKSSRQAEHAQRVAMQDVLGGEADRAIAPDARWRRLPRRPPRSGSLPRRLRGTPRRRTSVAFAMRVGGRVRGGQRGRDFAREPREIVLHGLELRDLLLERHALVGIVAPPCRASLPARPRSARLRTAQPISISAVWSMLGLADRDRLHLVERHGVGRLARKVRCHRRRGTPTSRPARPCLRPAPRGASHPSRTARRAPCRSACRRHSA